MIRNLGWSGVLFVLVPFRSNAPIQHSCHRNASHLYHHYCACLQCSLESLQRSKKSWTARMSSKDIMLPCPFVCLTFRLMFTSAGDLSQRLGCCSRAVRKHKRSVSSRLMGDSANWRSLLWPLVTIWQTEQSGLELIPNQAFIYLRDNRVCVERGSKESRGRLQVRWGRY